MIDTLALREFHEGGYDKAVAKGDDALSVLHLDILKLIELEERGQRGNKVIPAHAGYIEVLHMKASEPGKVIGDLVRWSGELPRPGDTMIVWGDKDAFQYRVAGVTHHVETAGGEDRLVKASVYVGLYEERQPRGPDGAGEW